MIKIHKIIRILSAAVMCGLLVLPINSILYAQKITSSTIADTANNSASATLAASYNTTAANCAHPLKSFSKNIPSNNELCDDNNDMVADTPKNINAQIIPKTLNLAFATIEDSNVYGQVYGELTKHLEICMKLPILVYPANQEEQVINALKQGKIHIASFGAGATMSAVYQAGIVPFASRGSNKKNESYQLWVIALKKSPYKKMIDLKGKKIAHTTPSSNSGNLAPRSLFPELGLVPEQDYKVEFSGRHDKSIMGVKNGFYDAAAVASDVFNRMIISKEINADDFNVIWKSNDFPTNSFSYYHKLQPAVVNKLKKCFFNFKFNQSKFELLNGNDTFVPVNYKKNWSLVRKVAHDAEKNTK